MLKTDNLVFMYEDCEDTVLDQVNISIPQGEFTAVLGHNGSGKSTLARHFNGMLLPCGGKVYADGMDTSDEKLLLKIRRHIGLVFQNPDNQIVATTVEDDVAFAPENLGVPSEEIRERVDRALEAVDMTEFAHHQPHKLSGGQKQRVAIAGILAMKPECIVLDEPTAMLDPVGRYEVMNTLKKLNREDGITIVLITHNMEEAAMADRIIVMSHGRVAMEGKPCEVFEKGEILSDMSLDVPHITDFCQKLNKAGYNISRNITDIDTAETELKALVFGKTFPKTEQKEYKCEGETVLETRNLHYVYKEPGVDDKPVLNDVNVHIKKGEYISVIGHTGSGKSTFVQLLNGLLKPKQGTVFFKGKDISLKGTNMRELRGNIGLVFQYPEYQLFEETVERDIAFGAKNMGLSPAEVKERVKKAIEAVGISEKLLDKSPFELSGGQKRRVAIAGVLAMAPQVLILDEPAAGLDPAGREKVLKLISRIHSRGVTVITVSHSMEDAARFADRLIVMNKGCVVMCDTPYNVYKNTDLLEKAGLYPPSITQLIQRVTGETVCTSEEALDYISCIMGGGNNA